MVLKYNSTMQKLGIILWKLRYPMMLNSELPIRLWAKLCFLIISDLPVSVKDHFIKDVIYSVNVDCSSVCCITIDQIDNLILPASKTLDYCWWVGVKRERDLQCLCVVNSPSLSVLKCNINAKRNLWDQISCFKRK